MPQSAKSRGAYGSRDLFGNDQPIKGKTLQKLALQLHFACLDRCQGYVRTRGYVPACGIAIASSQARLGVPGRVQRRPSEVGMAYKEIFWMACDSTEQLRAEYGPFHTRSEAELEARKLGFGFLLRYEHLIGDNEDIQEVRCIFIELPNHPPASKGPIVRKLHTRCATCGESEVHDEPWRAEVWADIHEFEHTRHRVRLFEQTRREGLKEIGDWRDTCA
jgi:hypothetical protein